MGTYLSVDIVISKSWSSWVMQKWKQKCKDLALREGEFHFLHVKPVVGLLGHMANIFLQFFLENFQAILHNDSSFPPTLYISLHLQERQIQALLRYHLIPPQMAVIFILLTRDHSSPQVEQGEFINKIKVLELKSNRCGWPCQALHLSCNINSFRLPGRGADIPSIWREIFSLKL